MTVCQVEDLSERNEFNVRVLTTCRVDRRTQVPDAKTFVAADNPAAAVATNAFKQVEFESRYRTA